jgi:hypothetical protein
MKKKLQIFISSTYTDLINERQAAVEAILKGGHIPAGMELFAAGNKSQLETIHRWIEESDVFMLVLGGRYGSIEPESSKSYTQLEYEYAANIGKPYFAVVLTEAAIDRKVAAAGKEVLEAENPKALKEFRKIVTSKICRMAEDAKDIKLAIHETLMDFLRQYEFTGWISGKELPNYDDLSKQFAELSRENTVLRAKNDELQASLNKLSDSSKSKSQNQEHDREKELVDLIKLLGADKLSYIESGRETNQSVIDWFYGERDNFVQGVTNNYGAQPFTMFLFTRVAPRLAIHNLMQDEAVPGVQWRRFRTTKAGNEMLAYLVKRLSAASAKSSQQPPGQSGKPVQGAPNPPGLGDKTKQKK